MTFLLFHSKRKSHKHKKEKWGKIGAPHSRKRKEWLKKIRKKGK